jgi:hypothetical protein
LYDWQNKAKMLNLFNAAGRMTLPQRVFHQVGLLEMPFLSKLSRFEVAGGRLVLQH